MDFLNVYQCTLLLSATSLSWGDLKIKKDKQKRNLFSCQTWVHEQWNSELEKDISCQRKDSFVNDRSSILRVKWVFTVSMNTWSFSHCLCNYLITPDWQNNALEGFINQMTTSFSPCYFQVKQTYSTDQRVCSITRVQNACTTHTLHAQCTQCPCSKHPPYVQIHKNACNCMHVILCSRHDLACKIIYTPSTRTNQVRVMRTKYPKCVY